MLDVVVVLGWVQERELVKKLLSLLLDPPFLSLKDFLWQQKEEQAIVSYHDQRFVLQDSLLGVKQWRSVNHDHILAQIHYRKLSTRRNVKDVCVCLLSLLIQIDACRTSRDPFAL